jgi:hypothetical protein
MKAKYPCLLLLIFISLSVSGQNLTKRDFFPVAVWLQSPENAMKYKVDGGINLYVGLWRPLNENQFELLKSAGIKLICEQNEFGLTHKTDPIIFGWMSGDEPDNAQWNSETQRYDPCISPEKVIEIYKKAKEKDPDHPYYLNLGQGVSFTDYIGRGECRGRTDLYSVANNGYLKGCDIASFDIYPVNSEYPEVKDKLWMGAKGIDSLRVWCNDSKPVWTWIETTRIGKDSPRKPTPEEVKAQVWMALIHGAKGIGYFCHSFYPESDEAALLHDQTMLAEVKKINQQINSLAGVLNSKNRTGIAEVNSSNKEAPIDLMTKRYENANYLFAVVMRKNPAHATFRVSSGTIAEVLGENRTLKISNGHFEDDFEPYGVHIYKISANDTHR